MGLFDDLVPTASSRSQKTTRFDPTTAKPEFDPTTAKPEAGSQWEIVNETPAGRFDDLIPAAKGGKAKGGGWGKDDELVTSGGWEVAGETAALPEGVRPSDAGAGRGKQGGPTAEQLAGRRGGTRREAHPYVAGTAVAPSAPSAPAQQLAQEPAPYRDKAEAIDDAVDRIALGANHDQVFQSFGRIGIGRDEIIARGVALKTPIFMPDSRPVTVRDGAQQGTMQGAEPTALQGMANIGRRAAARSSQAFTGVLASTGAMSPDSTARLLARDERRVQAAPPGTSVQRQLEALGQVNAWGQVPDALISNPAGVAVMLAESVLVSAPALAATMMGLPRVGMAAGVGVSSGAMEYGSALSDALADRGASLLDVDRVAALLADDKFLADVRERGAKRGLAVGTIDALTAGVAGRFVEPALAAVRAGKATGRDAVRRVAAASVAEVGMQAAGGAGGEALGQALTGEHKPLGIVMEALAEGVGAPLEVRSNLRAARAGAAPVPAVGGAGLLAVDAGMVPTAPTAPVAPPRAEDMPTTPFTPEQTAAMAAQAQAIKAARQQAQQDGATPAAADPMAQDAAAPADNSIAQLRAALAQAEQSTAPGAAQLATVLRANLQRAEAQAGAAGQDKNTPRQPVAPSQAARVAGDGIGQEAPAPGQAASTTTVAQQAGTDQPGGAAATITRQPNARDADGRPGVQPRGSIAEAARRQLDPRQAAQQPAQGPTAAPEGGRGASPAPMQAAQQPEQHAGGASASSSTAQPSAPDGVQTATPPLPVTKARTSTTAQAPTPVPGGPDAPMHGLAAAAPKQPGQASTNGLEQTANAVHESSARSETPHDASLQRTATETGAAHADPGRPAEPATGSVVAASTARAAQTTGRKPHELRTDLVAQIDEAMAQAMPDETALAAYHTAMRERPDAAALKRQGLTGAALERRLAAEQASIRQRQADAAQQVGFVTFDVPGDGAFKVLNTPERLADFRRQVEQSPGFKAQRNTTSTPPAAGNGGERASPSAKAAVINMLAEGDAQAARDYLAAKDIEPGTLGLSSSHLAQLQAVQPTPAQQPGSAARAGAAPTRPQLPDIPEDRLGIDRARLKGRTIQSQVLVQDTGEVLTLDHDAAGWMDSIDHRAKLLREGRLSGADSYLLRTRQDAYQADGKTPEEAHRLALIDAAEGLASERAEVEQLVREHHPDLFVGQADEAPQAGGPIADETGAKIGGSRRDRWRERGLTLADLAAMTEAEGAELVTKANVLRLDFARMIAAGTHPQAAAAVKVVADRLAAAPRDNSPDGRRRYVRAMQAVGEVYGQLGQDGGAGSTQRGIDGVLSSLRVGAHALRDRLKVNDPDPSVAAEGKRTLFAVYKGRSDPFAIGSTELQRARRLVEAGFPDKAEPWTRRFDIEAVGGPGTTDAGVAALLSKAAELASDITEQQLRDGAHAVRVKATRQTLAMAATHADAVAAARAVYAQQRTTDGDDGKTAPQRPHLDVLQREGLPSRIERDASPEDLISAFGFRGVEFGAWAAQDERQRMLNLAFDGLADLAELLGVPQQAISLNGSLGLAFGARGGGSHAAHYEPGRMVINLTKLQGGGSLAHEWAHALDHYLGELDQADAHQGEARGASGWRSMRDYTGRLQRRMVQVDGRWQMQETRPLANLRPELAQAIDTVMSTLYSGAKPQAERVRAAELELERLQAAKAQAQQDEGDEVAKVYDARIVLAKVEANAARAALGSRRAASQFAEEARKLSGKSGDYWLRPTEMLARAFEAYVFDRLAAMGARSDYLVHGVEEDRFAGGMYRGNPYPTGDERKAINAAFGRLFDTLQTRRTDRGVALFQRRGQAETSGDHTAASDARALRALRENDELFALPRSGGKTVAQIAADIAPQIKVRETRISSLERIWRLTMPDGTFALVTERKPNPYGPQPYDYQTDAEGNEVAITQRPGDNPDDVPQDTADIYIDASRLNSGGGGARVYAIAAAYAHNTGAVFIGDPAGLSDEALRRRSEQMLSSALKYGTTRHLAPHPRQVTGSPGLGVPALRWVYGDDAGNIRRLVDVNLAALENAGLHDIRFNPASGHFTDAAGHPLGSGGIGSRVASGAARGALAGRRTLARGAVLRALVREEGEALGGTARGRDGLLARLAGIGDDDAVAGIFYARTGERADPGRQQQHDPVAAPERLQRVQAAIAELTRTWQNAPGIEVLASMADAPAAARQADASQRAAGAIGTPAAFYVDGRVYLLAGQMNSQADVASAVAHEVLAHFGLRGQFGDALRPMLLELAALRAKDVQAKAEAYGLDYADTEQRLHAAEELLAELAETQPELGIVQRVLAAIRGWLRTHIPVLADLQLSDAELIARFIEPARAFVVDGHAAGIGAQPETAAAFARATRDSSVAGFKAWMDRTGGTPARPVHFFDSGRATAPSTVVPAPAPAPRQPLPAMLDVDGQQRPTVDANGRPLALEEDGVRAFWRWFGDSQTIDAQGRPLTLYHGTDRDFSTFSVSKSGAFGAGIYLADTAKHAGFYAGSTDMGGHPNLMPVYTALRNPYRYNGAAFEMPQAFADLERNSEIESAAGGLIAAVMPEGSARQMLARLARGKSSFGDVIRQRLMNMGHDGLIVTFADPADGAPEVIAFKPQQVKSAIGNSGAFDPTASDIRFQRRATPKDAPASDIQLREFGRAGRMVELLQDRYNRWKHTIDDVRKQGGTVNDRNDFYRAEERYWGQVGSGIEDFKDELRGFVEAVHADGLQVPDVALYAYAQHAPERNRWIAAKRPDVQDGGSGMTDAEAADIINAAREAGVEEQLQQHAVTLRKWIQGTRDVLYDGGLLGQDEYDNWLGMFNRYLPLRGAGGQDDAAGGQAAPGQARKPRGGVRGPESEHAEGRTSQALRIIEAIAHDRARALIRVGRNEVLRTFARFVLDNPAPDLWEVNAVEHKRTVSFDDDGNRVVEAEDVVIADSRTITLKDDGQEIHILVHDRKLLEQLQRMGVEEVPAWPIGALLSANRWLSRVYTSLSPVFTVVNALRDTSAAAIGVVDEIGLMAMPKLFAELPRAWADSFAGEFGRKSAKYQLFVSMGGRTAFHSLQTIDQQAKELEHIVVDSERSVIDPRKMLPKAMQLIEAINGAVENATRLAVFNLAQKEGKTDLQAVSVAKNITVNFNRRGTMASPIGAWVLFFNPAVQGTTRMLQALRNPATLGVLGVGMMGIAALALRNASMGDDDDGVAWWDKIPADVKERNVVIMLPPGAQSGEKVPGSKVGRYVKIPMPYGYNFFAVVANQVVDVWRHAQDPKRGRGMVKAGAKAFEAFASSWVPASDVGKAISADDPESAGKSAVLAAVPDALDPLARVLLNQDSFGRKLRPDGKFSERLPDSADYFPAQHGSLFQRAAQGMNTTTGGNRYSPGMVDIAPSTLEHLARSYGGGPVSFGLDIVNALYLRQSIERPTLDAKRLPFAKQFYGVIDAETDRLTGYQRLDDAEKVLVPLQRAQHDGSYEAVRQLRADAGPIARLSDTVHTTREQLGLIVKAERKAIDSPTMADGEKYTKLMELAERRRHVLQRFNMAYDRAIESSVKQQPEGDAR